MHGFRANPALSDLDGALLLQVCFGENEVILRFDEEFSITVMVDIGIKANQFRPVDPKLISSFLVSLLGKKVAHVAPVSQETLEIKFESGAALRVNDEVRAMSQW